MLSVVVPIYKNKKSLEQLSDRLILVLNEISVKYEIIYVNDGCPSSSWEKIQELCGNHNSIIGIKFSKNFGQHSAIFAGLKQSKGEFIVVMDGDLQDLPEEITKMYQVMLNENCDAVIARREVRHDSYFKIFTSKLFYFLFAYLTNTDQDSAVGNFGIYSRKIIISVLSLGDSHKYFPTMIQWVGYKKEYINVKHGSREDKSSYSFSKLINLAFSVLITFSDKPLRIVVRLGLCIVFLSIGIATVFLVKYLIGSVTVDGFTSLILSLWFLAGIIITILGVVGMYLGRLFEQVKGRPIYIIETILNSEL